MPVKPGKAKPSHKALARAVVDARNEKGLTQAALAKKAEMHATYLGGVQTGLRNPTWTVTSQLSQALGLQLSELVKHAEEQ